MALVRGYGVIFNRTIDNGTHPPFTVPKGGFMLAGFSVGLCLNHAELPRFASTNNATLNLWQDDHGLAFEAEVQDRQILNLIDTGQLTQASCGFDAVHIEPGKDGDALVFARTKVAEISLVAKGACPGTAIWLADTASDRLQLHQRIARMTWAVGKRKLNAGPPFAMSSGLVAARAAGSTQPPRRTSVPNSVTALLTSQAGRDYRRMQGGL
jgi:HK97 family phage prohead protease